jgi:hypothetical protein
MTVVREASPLCIPEKRCKTGGIHAQAVITPHGTALPFGLWFDLSGRQTRRSKAAIENFLLDRKRDPFVRRIGISL